VPPTRKEELLVAAMDADVDEANNVMLDDVVPAVVAALRLLLFVESLPPKTVEQLLVTVELLLPPPPPPAVLEVPLFDSPPRLRGLDMRCFQKSYYGTQKGKIIIFKNKY